jgi:apolipoprotein N-acyltransferase
MKMVMANPSKRKTEDREGKIENQIASTGDPQSPVLDLQESDDLQTQRPKPSVLPFPRLIAAIMSAGLLWACFFPLACSWLAWIALVPLLCLVRSEARARNIYWSAFAGGLAFFWPVLQWLRVGDYNMMYYSWGALATYCAAYFPLAIFLSRQIERRTALPLVLAFPAVWTALEFFRSYLLTGFPWYYLAHTQHDFLSLIQVSDLAGAYAVSFLVAAVNVLIFEWLYRIHWFRALFGLREPVSASTRLGLITQTAIVGLLVAGALIYGQFRLGQDSFDPGPRLALLQGNLDQDVRNDASESEQVAQQAFDHVRRLCDLAALERPQPQLLVWPENSCPQEWTEKPTGRPTPRSSDFAHRAADRWHTNVLFGLEGYSQDPGEKELRYNSAVLVTAHEESGNYRGQPSGRYDKIHRVPFGEYVPFQEAFPWMKTFAPYDFEYSIRSGKEFTRFDLASYRFGVLICFEDTDPYLARQYVGNHDSNSKIDFFVNISNDGWWRGTSGHDQHLAISRFRAIENRRAVCRSVNMGISTVIDGNGRVLEPRTVKAVDNIKIWEIPTDQEIPTELPVSRWSEFKQVQGVLSASVPIDHRTSLYAQWGDWFAWGCWIVVGVGLAWSLSNRFVGKEEMA